MSLERRATSQGMWEPPEARKGKKTDSSPITHSPALTSLLKGCSLADILIEFSEACVRLDLQTVGQYIRTVGNHQVCSHLNDSHRKWMQSFHSSSADIHSVSQGVFPTEVPSPWFLLYFDGTGQSKAKTLCPPSIVKNHHHTREPLGDPAQANKNDQEGVIGASSCGCVWGLLRAPCSAW